MITPGFSLTATERVLPKLALDFTTASLDSRITFTRALNTATVTNSSGYIVGINADLPRFDYDPVTLACKGLLIEESRTNAYTYSNTLNNTSVWNTARASVNANATTSPDGTNNGWFLKEDSTASSTHVLSTVSTVVIGTTYTISMCAKAGTRTYFSIGIYDNTTLNAWFNLSNGTLGTVNAGLTAAITPAGNGWYRCSITRTAAAITIYETFYLANADNSVSYSGDGTSGLYLYGGQHELGAFPTSYIPTTTLPILRNADNAIMTGTNFSSWYNASAGTIVANASRFGVPTGSYTRVVSLDDGTNSNVIRLISYIATASAEYTVTTATASIADIYTNNNAWPLNTYAKSSLGFKANSFYAAFNGAEMPGGNNVVTGAVPTVTQLQIGKAGTVEGKNFWIKSIYYYPQMLTKNEIISISK